MARKPNAKFMAPVKVSADLAAVVGNGPMPRTMVMKKLWAYIHKHGLQDRKNKRMINPDATLGKVVGHASLIMFAMTKKVFKHLG
ncbi:MAG: SWIB/MDM2 domain-containing protein [Candidatus Peregrinibacteria bacterium]